MLPFRVAAVALAASLALAGVPAQAGAQTVVQLEGGGSSLVDGYGLTANVWRPGSDGWVGIGYLDGLRIGAFLRTGVGKDTLRIGNDALQIRFPTDVFSGGRNLLVQGVSWTGGTSRGSYAVFGGASSSGIGAQSFQPTSVERPLGAIFVQRRVSPTVRLTGTAIVAERQTVIPGIEWQPRPDIVTSVVAGAGADRPYAASSLMFRRGRLGFKAQYAWNPQRFRRVSVPTPSQTETDRENVLLTYDLTPGFTVGVGRQNFVQDSSDANPPVRAAGNSIFAGGRLSEWRVTAGLYDSRSQGVANLSSYLALGHEVSPWLDAELYVLQSRPDGRPVTTTPLANLRWRVSSHVGLMQQVSYQGGRATVLFGANLATSVGEFGVDYQIVHQPFQPFQPFRSALNLTARLQLGGYSTSFGTYVRPDGAVDYSASGRTFLYMGSQTGAQPLQSGGGIGRFLVRGVVRDADGAPVEGAALDLGGQVVFTNSQGVFFLRDSRPRRLPLTVLLEEFLLPGRWSLEAAPSTVDAQPENRSSPVEVRLLRVGNVAPVPAAAPTGPVAPDSLHDRGSAGPVTSSAPTLVVIDLIRGSDLDPSLDIGRRDLERDVIGPHRVPVRFAWGSRRVPASLLPVLDTLARRLLQFPDAVVEIQGHTDATGGRRANLRLSRARADEVRRQLVNRGVPSERILTRGLGADRPLGDNRVEAGRALNRRVEVHRAEPNDTAYTHRNR
jgi:outer membrane protein OmpA-like peptidoglycan-associated protein